MSFSSILSGNINEPSKDPQAVVSPPRQTRKSSGTPNGEAKTAASSSRQTGSKTLAASAVSPRAVKKAKKPKGLTESPYKSLNGMSKTLVPSLSDKENEKIQKELEKIDVMPLSPLEASDWENEKVGYNHVHGKRQIAVNEDEKAKRRVSDIMSKQIST